MFKVNQIGKIDAKKNMFKKFSKKILKSRDNLEWKIHPGFVTLDYYNI